jgi:tetratricopeptide (TPR) repeat protein
LNNLPNRHRNHEIETLSERFFNNQVPVNWVVNKLQLDYGTDLNCEIVIDKGVTGMNFSVQLKGKEKESNTESIKIPIKRTTIKRWLNKLEPTMIIVYIVNEDEAFWLWFEDNTVDLTLKNDSFTISIPRNNKLSQLDWNNCIEYLREIFKKRHLLYAVPKIDGSNKIAWDLFKEKKHQRALSYFYEFLQKTPKDAIMLEAIALCEYELFNYQKALIHINKALEIENNDGIIISKASILTEQGILLKDKSLIRDALVLFEDLILRGHSSYPLYYNYGSALSNVGEHERSIIFFKKAIKLNPNKAQVWNNMGNSYMEIGEHDLKMKCYENALQINPDLAETLFNKGSSLVRYEGKAEEGLSLMLQATEKSDRYEIDTPNVFFWITEAYIILGDFENALYWNKRGLSNFSNDIYLQQQKTLLD